MRWECEYAHYILTIGTYYARDLGFRKLIRSSSQAATAIGTRAVFTTGAPPSEPPVYQARVGAVERLSSKFSLGSKSNGLRCQHYQQTAWTARVAWDGEGTDAKGSNPNQCNLIWFEYTSKVKTVSLFLMKLNYSWNHSALIISSRCFFLLFPSSPSVLWCALCSVLVSGPPGVDGSRNKSKNTISIHV